ncbi:MAG: rod shape-determining protein RodA [Ruminococcaceae bacterium]|nr:rod shape-determining protein RodA [Oscillospiraceae bacterium]
MQSIKKNHLILSLKRFFTESDHILWTIIIIISVFALLLLKSVSRATNTDYFETQLIAVLLGLVGAFFFTVIDYKTISNYWVLIAVFSVFFLIYTMLFGVNISGSGGVNATAWINIAGRTFQSSELVKILFIITYAKHLDILKNSGKLNQVLSVISLGIHAFIPFFLCHEQGDDGAGFVFFAIFIFMSIVAGVHLRYFAILFGAILVVFPFIWKFVLSEYQILRFTSVYNLDDPTIAMNEGYQQYQGRISIGSGGFFGYGYFQGPRVETNAVTFQHSDFIFSVAGEEFGFIGCSFLILLLFVLMIRLVQIASKARDDMGKYICIGFFGLVAFQTVTNIGMCLAILPVMGVTLPFFSAGGSSAACLYFGIGLIQNVYMRRNDHGEVRLNARDKVRLRYDKLKEHNL